MQRINKTKDRASDGGRIKVEKNSNLVSWSVVYGKNEKGIDESYVAITFSSQARAKTKLGGHKQFSHTSAYALGLAQVMQTASRLAPKPEDDYRGINALVSEMSLFLKRDLFFFKKFNLFDSADSVFISAGPQNFEDALKEQVLARKNAAASDIIELSNASAAVKAYKAAPNSLTASTAAGIQILRCLGNIQPNRLDTVEQNIRRGYVCDVTTIAAGELLKYQNTAPYVTFPEIPANDEKEINFRKTEGPRVKGALKVLAYYSSSAVTLDAVVDDLLDEYEEELLDEGEENTFEQDNLSKALETGTAATIIPVIPTEEQKRSTRAASLPLGGYSEKALQKQQEENAQQIKRKEEIAKKEGKKAHIIANAIYNLLSYKPVENYEEDAYKNAIDKRTNNLDILCFVVTKHLAMIFDTFEGLEGLKEQDEIINIFLEKMMRDWSKAIDAAPIEQKPKEENVNERKLGMSFKIRGKTKQKAQEDSKKRCEELLKKKIKDTLSMWDIERGHLKIQNENAKAQAALTKTEQNNDFSINIGSPFLSEEEDIRVSLNPIFGEPNYEGMSPPATTLQQGYADADVQSSNENKVRERALPMPISKLSGAGLSQLLRNTKGPSFKNSEDDSEEGISLLKSNSIQQNAPPQTPVHSSSKPRGVFGLFSPLFSSSKKKKKEELSQARSLVDHQSDNAAVASTDNAAGQPEKGKKKQ